MILAKKQGREVRLVVQPQRAAFPGFFGAAVVRGRCGDTGPSRRSGVVQAATLHHPAVPAVVRQTFSRQKATHTRSGRHPRASRAVRTCPPTETSAGPTRPGATDIQTGFVTPVPLGELLSLSLAAGAVSTGLRTYQGQAASRWPPASLDSSCAPRSRQLREEQGEKWPGRERVHPDFVTLRHYERTVRQFSRSGFSPG